MAAWVLNLDADLELAATGPYSPSLPVRVAMRPHMEPLKASLLRPGDMLIDEGAVSPSARGLRGRAFCPTPRALALLRRAGAAPDPHPPVAVLRRVNSRAFASALGATLPGAAFVTDAGAAFALLHAAPQLGDGWRVKHAFGMAGRNQRVIRGLEGEQDERDRAFVTAGLARGGVQIEPNVSIEDEYALHGVLGLDGSLEIGELVRQRCDARGAWLATERIDRTAEPLVAVREPIFDELRRVAGALFAAGYHGPFGIDAYSYRGGLQTRSEINARYSMGFAIGFGPPP